MPHPEKTGGITGMLVGKKGRTVLEAGSGGRAWPGSMALLFNVRTLCFSLSEMITFEEFLRRVT